jgi:LPXTG-site transpeptidase (sortase) family protein
MRARLAFRLAGWGLSLAIALTACAHAKTPEVSVTPSALPATNLPARPAAPTPTPGLAAATPTEFATATVAPASTATPPAPDEQTLRLPDNALPALGVPTAIVGLEVLAAPRLVIPQLNLDVEIVKVPALHGVWDLTHLEHRIGWLETTGQTPDDKWAMALAGHLTVSLADMGPFANLWKLHVSDEVIYRAGDTDYVYGVKYKIEANPDETYRLYVEGKHQLLLVTCAEWDYAAWKYGKRLIVVAEEVTRRASP